MSKKRQWKIQIYKNSDHRWFGSCIWTLYKVVH